MLCVCEILDCVEQQRPVADPTVGYGERQETRHLYRPHFMTNFYRAGGVLPLFTPLLDPLLKAAALCHGDDEMRSCGEARPLMSVSETEG